jgi:biopolymer transport protein ExbD
MGEIIESEKPAKGKKKRARKHGTHIDMTPMVDLFCLLLTFFMLTTAFNKPKVMQIVLPEKPKKDQQIKSPEVSQSRALTLILADNDRILWYAGKADPTKPPLPVLNEVDFSKDGIRKLLLQRNKELYKAIYLLNKDFIEGKIDIPQDTLDARVLDLMRSDERGPIIFLKASDDVKYKNLVDIIDEMVITNIARYTLADINPVEKMMVRNFKNSNPSVAASN